MVVSGLCCCGLLCCCGVVVGVYVDLGYCEVVDG